jgi:tricorn protease
MSLRFSFASLLLASALCANAQTQLLRFPDVSNTEICLVYGGDIYVVPRIGGAATRLTSHVGSELFPKFSPDGKHIAFSAEYSGSRQVYVMPSDGSADPTQLTWYNDIGPMPPRGGFDYRVLDWTPDGKNIVVRMNRLGVDERAGRPYLVPVDGGDEKPLAVPETGGGMLSPDGSKFVYTPIDREFRTWKRTRGGRAQDVWVFDLKANTSLQLTDNAATDNQPMWLGDSVFFTSDRDYTLNLYQMPATGGQAKKRTEFKEFDVLWPSAGMDAIVFENAGSIYFLGQTDAAAKRVDIRIGGDHVSRQASVKNVAPLIQASSISAGGERVYFAARGELFSVNTTQGDIRNISNTPSVREHSASLSADGNSLFYLSDASGEYELYRRDLKTAQLRSLTKNSTAWYLPPSVSADGNWVVLGDTENRLQLIGADGSQKLIDTATRSDKISTYLFSPDSKSVVYVKSNATSMREIWWYGISTGKAQRVLGGQFDAFEPSFDPSGRYLYFASNREHNLTYSSYEQNYLYTNATRLFAAALRADGPFLNALADSKGAQTASSAALDLDGMQARAEALQIPSGNYAGLIAGKDGLFFLSIAATGNELKYFALAGQKTELVAPGIQQYQLDAGGQKLLLQQGEKWIVADAKPGTDLSKALDLSKLTLRVDPRQEWPQLYADALRIFRTWFYDAGMHGNDWKAIENKYAALVPALSTRDDLDYLLGEVAGELNAGHAYVNRGDSITVPRVESGLLGGEFSRLENGSYRIDKIFSGQSWSPEFRAPLQDVGVDARVGDIIFAIDDVPTNSVRNFYQLLEGKGAQIVRLSLQRADRRWVELVKTVTAETNLRYLDWVQTRADMVTRLSGGRVGYVHLPNTAVEGNRELFKQFPSQTNKEALIVDDRYNGGGFIPDRMIELLARKPLNYWKRRGLAPEATPLLSHRGPKAMLINGLSSSGGDALPYYFKSLKLGPLIGTRTWGGLIGLSGNPALADGGSVTVPDFRIMSTGNKWVVENEGVAPDIEVIDRPELLAAGRDPSVERAVQELLKQLDAAPLPAIQAPAAPREFGQSK